MDAIYYEPKYLMPGVILDKHSNKFRIFGASCPMEPFEFFNPIIDWFHEYSVDPLQKTVFEIYFTYFDTSTSKFFLRILYILEDIQEMGFDVIVNWYYSEEDEDMLDEGEEFERVSVLDFDMISIMNNPEYAEDDRYFEEIVGLLL